MLSLSMCPHKTFPDGSQAKGGKYFMLILDRTAQWNYIIAFLKLKKTPPKPLNLGSWDYIMHLLQVETVIICQDFGEPAKIQRVNHHIRREISR